MDPAWTAILVGVVSSLITGAVVAAVNYAALRAWMARREEREQVIKEDVTDHELRIRVLERGQPLDYASHR
jgi:uncharacterized protein YqiB (DUF1249 family)